MGQNEAAPRCECHGEEMGWRHDRRYVSGGYFRCRVKERERMARVYERDGFKIRQRQELYKHRQRLRELESRLALREGGSP